MIVWCLAAMPALAPADEPAVPRDTSASTIKAFNEFSWKLFGRVAEKNRNVVISPIGAATVLAIAADGARGPTREEIVAALGLPQDDASISDLMKHWKADVLDDIANDSAGEWRFAQSIWVDSKLSLDKRFAARWKADLGTEVRPARFSRAPEGVARAMNEWSDRQTRGAIKSVVDAGSFDRETSLFLVSAVFLEKKWAHTFKPENTAAKAFHLNETESVRHPLMFQRNRFHLVEAEDFQAIELPYKDSAAAMVVILPRRNDGLEKLESSLDSDKLTSLWAALQKAKPVKSTSGGGFFSVESSPPEDSEPLETSSWDIDTELTLPRFQIRSKIGLTNGLKSEGIQTAFDRGAGDFAGLLTRTPEIPVFLTEVMQHAMIEVDEQGTRAAAVTTGGFGGGGEPPKRAVFRADHPFLFVIVHRKTGAVLFLGRLCNPSE
ncbi:MAG TPA: serpin family protein [Caulifigura sp.]|nr:serpin family protein [Caulifigura sp.]